MHRAYVDIGVNAFRFSGCRNLREITFNEGMQKIGIGAFKGCTSLENQIPLYYLYGNKGIS